ncbi:MAG: arginine--tRNA ligase [Kiritimatiellaeota bacterium]|nr:arginine--tRNA ligase [Kiritimatiellota bacterium]
MSKPEMDETLFSCEAGLSAYVAGVCASLPGVPEDFNARVAPATDRRFGDFQCNDALALGKALGRPPRKVAEDLVARMDPLPPMLAKVEVAGPGFINFTLSDAWLAGQTQRVNALPLCGIPQTGGGQTVVMDYAGPNIAKSMQVHHIRSIVIGNALDRIHRALGYRVIADNHIGDWGTQFGIIIRGFRELADPAALEASPVEELERVYVASYQRTKDDPDYLDACRQELVRLQQGDPENLALWKRFVDLSLSEFGRVYKRLGVSFDLHRGESFYNPLLPAVLERLNAKNLAEESEGALVVKLDDEGLPLCIVRKRDGGFNYTTTDIATVFSREEEFAPARVIYVTDERQQLHFKQFFAVCKKLGATTRLEHVWFGLMRLPEGAFSTREGNVIKLEALLDEAERRARAIIDASSPEMPDAEKAALSRDIGIGAVKYADLGHDPRNMITFTWDRALALEGNSGPYLQYACARVSSLLAKYADAALGRDPLQNEWRPGSESERALGLELLRFPQVVSRAAEVCKPSVLADYLYGLSQAYSTFYQSSPVLKSEPETRDSRVRLCAMVLRVLRQGLDLLGIAAPERI